MKEEIDYYKQCVQYVNYDKNKSLEQKMEEIKYLIENVFQEKELPRILLNQAI